MSFDRKKGTGYEDVKQYMLDRILSRKTYEDPFVRISGEEISAAIGITRQAIHEHVQVLLRRGVIRREGRFYYALGERLSDPLTDSVTKRPNEVQCCPENLGSQLPSSQEQAPFIWSNEAILVNQDIPTQKIASRGHVFRNCHFYIVTEDARDEPSL